MTAQDQDEYLAFDSEIYGSLSDKIGLEPVDALRWIEYQRDLNSMVNMPPSVPYTSAWRGSTSDGALGNGTLRSRYRRIGSWVWVSILFVYGSSGVTNPVGNWQFDLPDIPFDDAEAVPQEMFLTGRVADGGVVSLAHGLIRADLAGTAPPVVSHIYAAGSAGNNIVTSTTPFTWASGDLISLSGWYETGRPLA